MASAEREYCITVTQEVAMFHWVTATNANEARRIVQRLISGDDTALEKISDTQPGANAGREIIRMVEPVVQGQDDRLDLRQCVGRTAKGSRCSRRAWASANGYLCGQHLWQDGVEDV